MPPCAHAVADSLKPRLAIKTTFWVLAKSKATVSPARPAPMMRTGKSAASLWWMVSADLALVVISQFYGASAANAAFSIKEKGLAVNEAFDPTS